MAKVPKQKRIKRATVLIKRSRCVRNIKKNNKPHSPLYQKLKVNNHSLARALSQEKEENQLLFARNIELQAEVQDLVHACNNRDRVISNILKNAKDMIQMLVTMSGFLTNTISSCQEFVSNQVSTRRTSSSSAGRRDSNKRMSTKSPARGVVKPMVSGYTITKPTINLSRVNMQRLQNPNLSIIPEGPAAAERSMERPTENRNRRSRTMPERIPVSSIRDEGSDEEERIIINRRTSRFSQGRLSAGRYSKRNSGRLSGGGGMSSRLSRRSSDYAELIQSPWVTLQDVSRYLTNNQTINVRLLSETTNGHPTNNTTTIEETQISETPFSPEFQPEPVIIPETQESCETTTTNSSSDSDDLGNNTIRSRTHDRTANATTKLDKRNSSRKMSSSSRMLNSQMMDALEGTSWMYDSTMETEEISHNNGTLDNGQENEQRDEEVEQEQGSSPLSSLSIEQRRGNTSYFCMPDHSKNFGKSTNSRSKVFNDYNSPNTSVPSTSNGIGISRSYPIQDDDDETEDQRVNLRFITQRRGLSAHNSNISGRNNERTQIVDQNDDDDDETLMLNIQRQVRQNQTQQQFLDQPLEQPERLQFDMNELLQLTPLKPLLDINTRTNNGPIQVQVDIEPEPTATVQLTQKIPRPPESTDTFSRLSTIKIHQNGLPDLPAVSVGRGQDAGIENTTVQNKRLSDISRLSSKIELPRLTEMFNMTEDNHQQSQIVLTPVNHKQSEVQKRKRVVTKPTEEVVAQSDSENNEEIRVQKKKKARQPRKKVKDKDPSSAKVVLQKLNETSSSSSHTTDKRTADETLSSTKSYVLSRADQSSDSEGSTASSHSKKIPSRPRRQHAPKNMQEPGLRKKLRRDPKVN